MDPEGKRRGNVIKGVAVGAVVGAAVAVGAVGIYDGIQRYRYDEFGSPRTHDAAVDTVTKDVLAEIRALEAWEGGRDPNYYEDSPCAAVEDTASDDPFLSPLVPETDASGGKTRYPASGGGGKEVGEVGRWTKGGNEDPDKMAWRIFSGRNARAERGVIVSATRTGFTARILSTLGLAKKPVREVSCTSDGGNSDFVCTVREGVNTVPVRLDSTVGNRFLEWFRCQIKERITAMSSCLDLSEKSGE